MCFVRPLKDVLPAYANNVLYVLYDFVNTQNKRYSDTKKHMCLTSCACNSFVRGVSSLNTIV